MKSIQQPESSTPGSASSPIRSVERADLLEFARRHVGVTIALLTGVGLFAAGINFLFEDEVRRTTTWIAREFGIGGMAALLFLSDTFISPLPPDLLLIIVAKSHLREAWWIPVGILGVTSALAGQTGWLIGLKIGQTRFARKLLGHFREDHQDMVKKYGAWAVVLGATTPLPFSVTCWTAGIFKLSWNTLALASLARIPRFVIYYLVIHASIRG